MVWERTLRSPVIYRYTDVNAALLERFVGFRAPVGVAAGDYRLHDPAGSELERAA